MPELPNIPTPERSNALMPEFPESLSWRVRLSDKAHWKLWVVYASAFLAGALGFVSFGHPLLGIVGVLIILGSTAEFWLGTTYTLNAKGATSRCGLSVTSLEWESVKRVIIGEEGIKISPLEASGRFSPFRGVMLRLKDNREKVLETIRGYVGEDVRIVEGGTD